MDIQTKDGILLRGVPDGTPDEAIKARIQQIRAGQTTPAPAAVQQSSGQTAPWQRLPNMLRKVHAFTEPVAEGVGGLVGGMLAAPGVVTTPLGVGIGAGIGRAGENALMGALGLPDRRSGTQVAADTATTVGINAVAPKAVEGAVRGVGSLASGTGNVLKRGYNALRGAPLADEEIARRATGYLGKSLGRDNLNPADLELRLARGDKPEGIVDVAGQNTQAALRMTTSTPGAARQQVAETLTERQAGQRERVIGDLLTGLKGNIDTYGAAGKVLARRQQNAKDSFETAFYQGVVRTKGIDALFQSPAIKSAIPYAQRIAGNEYALARAQGKLGAADAEDWGKAVGDLPNKKAFPTRYLHYLKMGLDEHLESFRDPITGVLPYNSPQVRSADLVRKQYRGEVRRMNPSYGKALDEFATDASLLTAQRNGEVALKLDPEEITKQMAGLNKQERTMYLRGFARSLSDRIESMPDNTNAVRKLIGDTLTRRKITTVIGDSKRAGDFMRAMERENAIFNTGRAQGRSVSSGGDEADFAADQGLQALQDVASKGVTRGLISQAVGWMGRKFAAASGMNEQVKDRLARMLLSTNPDENKAAFAALRRMNEGKMAKAQAQQPYSNALGRGLGPAITYANQE